MARAHTKLFKYISQSNIVRVYLSLASGSRLRLQVYAHRLERSEGLYVHWMSWTHQYL